MTTWIIVFGIGTLTGLAICCIGRIVGHISDDYVFEVCALCLEPFTSGEKAVQCAQCGAKYHPKCAVITSQNMELVRKEVEAEEVVEDGVININLVH